MGEKKNNSTELPFVQRYDEYGYGRDSKQAGNFDEVKTVVVVVVFRKFPT